MTRDQVGEILDLYRSFESGSKETPEGPHSAGKQRENEHMDMWSHEIDGYEF